MASFGQLKLTNRGVQAQVQAQNGGTALKFTKIGMGSGVFTGDATSLTTLVKEEVLVAIDRYYTQDNMVFVLGTFANENLTASFIWREIGLYFEDEAGNNVLYCYGNAKDKYDVIPATADERYTKTVRIATAFSNAEHVTIQVSPGTFYVEVGPFEAWQKEVNEKNTAYDNHVANEQNPHKVTKQQVGLGNVPNVATNDQTPTYTVPNTLAALVSGEKMNVAMGKIAKAIVDTIAHIGSKQNPHAVSPSQINAMSQLATYYTADSAMSADNLLDSLALIPLSTTLNAQLYSILNGTFAYVLTFFYQERAVTARRSQIAISYNSVPAKMAYRIYGSSGWLDWEPVTQARDLDKYLLKTGGEITGRVTSRTSQSVPFVLNKSDKSNADVDWIQDLQFETSDGVRVSVIRSQVNAAGNRVLTLGVSNAANVAPAGLEVARDETNNYVYVKAPPNGYPGTRQISNTYAGTTSLTAGSSAMDNNCIYQMYE